MCSSLAIDDDDAPWGPYGRGYKVCPCIHGIVFLYTGSMGPRYILQFLFGEKLQIF
jgi:hypothetical protein